MIKKMKNMHDACKNTLIPGRCGVDGGDGGSGDGDSDGAIQWFKN